MHVHEGSVDANLLSAFIPAAEASEAAAPTTFADSVEAKCW